MFKSGDRAVSKGIEVDIITAPHGAFCTNCRGLICTCDLVGYIESHQFICAKCLVPADREEKVKRLVEATKIYVSNYNLRLSERLKNSVIDALHDLGEDV